VETVDIGDNCIHRPLTGVAWIKNDGTGPPVLLVLKTDDVVLTLTNQRIVVNCPTCFEKIRAEGLSRYSLETLHRQGQPPPGSPGPVH